MFINLHPPTTNSKIVCEHTLIPAITVFIAHNCTLESVHYELETQTTSHHHPTRHKHSYIAVPCALAFCFWFLFFALSSFRQRRKG